jgi:hypothetical protein
MKKYEYTKNNKLFLKKIVYMVCLSYFFLQISSACNEEKLQQSITIQNNSSDSICFLYTEKYPDTLIDCKLVQRGLGPKQEYKLELRNGWENEFSRIHVLQIFIIDLNIVRTEPCDTIRKYNKILKRYQLTLDDVEKINWTITYP